jgi:hypothetical protein
MSSIPETPSINLFFLVLAFFIQYLLIDKKIGKRLGKYAPSLIHVITSFFAAGTTISNIAYSAGGYLNYLRKCKLQQKMILISLVIYLILVFSPLHYASFLQNTVYPEAYQFSKISDYFTIHLKRQYLYTSPTELSNVGRITTLLTLFYSDCIVAPKVILGDVIAYNIRWNILTLTHQITPIYVLSVVAYLYLLLSSLYKINSDGQFKNKDVQLIFFYLLFNTVLLYFFETVGPPFIFSTLNVFGLTYLTMFGYSLEKGSKKRVVLVIFVILLVINNWNFISDINYLLKYSNPLPWVKL